MPPILRLDWLRRVLCPGIALGHEASAVIHKPTAGSFRFARGFCFVLGVLFLATGLVLAENPIRYASLSRLTLFSVEPPPEPLDTSFDFDGKVTTAFNDFSKAKDVAIQTDGKIVAVGVLNNKNLVNGDPAGFAVARYNSDGSLDTDFSADGRANTSFDSNFDSEANAVAIQGDGKVVVVGYQEWLEGYGSSFALARFNSDGTLDDSFDGDGRVLTDFNFTDEAHAVAIQPDGKIVVAGVTQYEGIFESAVLRYNSDGSLDTSFDADGRQSTRFVLDGFGQHSFGNALALQSDGKILVAGYTSEPRSVFGSRNFALARYGTDGALDSSFDGDGMVTTVFGDFSSPSINSVAIQSDGRIVAAGGDGEGGFRLARYLPNGSLDSSFDGDGILTTDFGGAVEAVRLQSDGRIVVAGTHFLVARFHSTGALDDSFDGDGRVTTAFGKGEGASALAIQSNGRIVVAGFANNSTGPDFALVRYLANGSVDSSFDHDGKVTTGFGHYSAVGKSIVLSQPTSSVSRIAVAGHASQANNEDFAMAEYDYQGQPTLFSYPDGRITTNFAADNVDGDDLSQAVARQSDGKYLSAGFTTRGSDTDFALVRYLSFGIVDDEDPFGTDGRVVLDFSNGDDQINALAMQGDGKIIAAGSATVRGLIHFALARFHEDGTVDTSFHDDGKVLTTFGSGNDQIFDISIQGDGKIVAAGFTYNGVDFDFALARYNPDGSLDTSFSEDGKTTVTFGSGDEQARGVVLQSDGRIVVAGYSGHIAIADMALARLQIDGSLDASFGGDGRVTTDWGLGEAQVANDVAIQKNGKIVAAGYAHNGQDNDFALVYYQLDGSLDTSYDGDGIVTTNFGADDFGEALVIQNDGKVVIGGHTGSSGSREMALARYVAPPNSTVPSISISDAIVTEGNDGISLMNFTVSLTSATGGPVTMNYRTADGSASSATDYVGIVPTPLTFDPGETSKIVSVAIIGDDQVEHDESLLLNLSAPSSNATILDSQGVGTILNDDNTPPIISNISDQTIDEDAATAAIPFTIGDALTPSTVLTVSGTSNSSLVPDENIVFGGSGPTRNVTVTPNANQNGVATITVTVTDPGGLTASETFILTVNQVEDPPTISDTANRTISEDTTTGAIAVSISDLETTPGNLIVAGASSDESLVPPGNIIFGGSGANRTVTITPSPNQFGNTLITLTVTDSAGLTATDTFDLSVTSVNDAPVISAIPNQTIDENTVTDAVPFTVGDIETPAASLALSGTSLDPALVPNGNIVFGGSGAARTVTVTPAPGKSGVTRIIIAVTDGEGRATNQTFRLKVRGLSFQNLHHSSFTGPSIYAAGIGFSPANRPAVGWSEVSSSSPNNLFWATRENGTWVKNTIAQPPGGISAAQPSFVVNPNGTPFYAYSIRDAYIFGQDWYTAHIVDLNSQPTGHGISVQPIEAGQSCLASYPRFAMAFVPGNASPIMLLGATCPYNGWLSLNNGTIHGAPAFRTPAGTGGEFHSIDYATGPGGSHHVTYYSERGGPNWGAFYSNGSPGHELLLAIPHRNRAAETSVAVGPEGRIHVAIGGVPLCDNTFEGGLLYLTSTDGVNWTRMFVDQLSGRAPSIAVDSEGNPHIAYWRNGTQVRLASLVQGVWSTTPIYTGTTAVGRASVRLKFDLDDQPHTLFFNPDTNDLQLASGVSTNPPPSMTNPGGQTSYRGTNVLLQISATDPAGGPIQFSACSLPPGLNINPNTGLISGSIEPTSPLNSYKVTITATDAGGDTSTASFDWSITPTPNTPAGSNVIVQTGDAVLTFAGVSVAGTTTLTPISPNPAELPGGYSFCPGCPAFDISTTANYSAPVTVCLAVPGAVEHVAFLSLKLMHQENGAYVDRTTGHYTQTGGQRFVCGVVQSLSPFALASSQAPTAAPATISGRITTAEGAPVGGVTITLSGGQQGFTVTDNQGNYSFANVQTENLYVLTPSRVNFTFTPAYRSFSLLGNTSDAAFTAVPVAVPGGNPLDTPEYFVRQHYLDFLGREPDAAGLAFWSNQLRECSDAGCLDRRRINVSAAYFLSIEFQETGGVVDGVYRTSYGRRPLYAEFMPDIAGIAKGVVVGTRGWEQTLVSNKRAFIESFVSRAGFREDYDGLSNEGYVDRLISNTQVQFGNSLREALVIGLNTGSLTRAEVLLRIAENEDFVQAKRNEAFVMMEYFGYLRRDPDESGYEFWLNKLNQFDGNFEQAEMVKAFISSVEYRSRFR